MIEVYFPVYDPMGKGTRAPEPDLTGYAQIYATEYGSDEEAHPSLPFGIGSMETVWDALVDSTARVDKKLAWKPASHLVDGTQISPHHWGGESANLAVLISFAATLYSITAKQVGTDALWATGVVKDGHLDNKSLHTAGKLDVFWTWCEKYRRTGLFVAPLSSKVDIRNWMARQGKSQDAVWYFERNAPWSPRPPLSQPEVLLVPNDCVADLLVQLTAARLRLREATPAALPRPALPMTSDLRSLAGAGREERLGTSWHTLGPESFVASLRPWFESRGITVTALERYALGSIFTSDAPPAIVGPLIAGSQGAEDSVHEALRFFCKEQGVDWSEILVRLAASLLLRQLGGRTDALTALVEQTLRRDSKPFQFELLVQLLRWAPELLDPLRRRSVERALRQDAYASGQRLQALVRLQRVDRLLWEAGAFQGQSILTAASIQWARQWADLWQYLAPLVRSFGVERVEPYLELLADPRLATSPEVNWCPLARALRGLIRSEARYLGTGNQDLDLAFRCSLPDADSDQLALLRDRPQALRVWLALMEEPFNEAQLTTVLAHFQGDSRRAILAGQCLVSASPLKRIWDRLDDGERRRWVDTWPAERFSQPNVTALLQALAEGRGDRDDEGLVYLRTRQHQVLPRRSSTQD